MAHRDDSHDPATTVSDKVALAAAHLAVHLRGRLHGARLSVQSAGVVIHGRAGSYYVKQLAQQAVMKRVSLPIAANEIEVFDSGRDAPAPSTLVRAILDAQGSSERSLRFRKRHSAMEGAPG